MKSLRSEVKQSGAGVVSFCLILFLYYIAVLVFDAPNSPLVTNLRKKILWEGESRLDPICKKTRLRG